MLNYSIVKKLFIHGAELEENIGALLEDGNRDALQRAKARFAEFLEVLEIISEQELRTEFLEWVKDRG